MTSKWADWVRSQNPNFCLKPPTGSNDSSLCSRQATACLCSLCGAVCDASLGYSPMFVVPSLALKKATTVAWHRGRCPANGCCWSNDIYFRLKYATEKWNMYLNLPMYRGTVFENNPKCRIWIFQFWHFPPIFDILKLTCLVTLFDCKL